MFDNGKTIKTPCGDEVEIVTWDWPEFQADVGILIPISREKPIPLERVAEWMAAAAAHLPEYEAEQTAQDVLARVETQGYGEHFYDAFSFAELTELIEERNLIAQFPDNNACKKAVPLLDRGIEYVQMYRFAKSIGPKERKRLGLPLTHRKSETEDWIAHCRATPEYAAFLAHGTPTAPPTQARQRK